MMVSCLEMTILHLETIILCRKICSSRIFYLLRHYEESHLLPSVCDRKLIQQTLITHVRVWNRRYPIKPQLPEHMPNAWITNMSFPRESLYPQLCCIAYWLSSIYSNNTFTSDIKQLFQRHPKVSSHLMGFSNGWEEESLWA